MPLVVLSCKVENGLPKGISRKMPAITKQALLSTAMLWHERMLQGHFTPGNESRYRFDPRNAVYLKEIKAKEGISQGRYVKDILKGQSLRWLRAFTTFSATSNQSTVRMSSPTYFENPFLGTFIDPKSGKTKHVTRQPNKPGEVTQINDSDKVALQKFARENVTKRVELLMRGTGRS